MQDKDAAEFDLRAAEAQVLGQFGSSQTRQQYSGATGMVETARYMLETQLYSAHQEALDLRIILDMLPSSMSVEQNTALRRLLERGGRR